MTLGVDFLQRTQVFHDTKVSSVSKLTFSKKGGTRFREPQRAHQAQELDSCVPAMLPPAHVCAAKLRQGTEAEAQNRRLALPLVEVGHKTF